MWAGSPRRRNELQCRSALPQRKSLIKVEPIKPVIRVVRGQRVVLAADLAEIYGVATKVFNQAVRRNSERFPADFMFRLTAQERDVLRSQIVTSRSGSDHRDAAIDRRSRE